MLDLFSGIGGFALAAETVWRDELDLVAFCEIDPYCHKVLNKNFPQVPIHEDIKILDGTAFKDIDLLTGGFPCQDISVAGRGEGLSGDRSYLWFEMLRIIRDVRPRYALVENVPMLTSRGGTRVLADLAEIGYNAEWTIISARDVGARHLRKRIWIVAYPDSELRRRRRAIREGREDQEGKLRSQEKGKVSYDVRSEAVRRSTLRGETGDISDSASTGTGQNDRRVRTGTGGTDGGKNTEKASGNIPNSDNSGSGTSRYETDKDRQKENKGRERLTQSEPSGHSTKVSDTTVKGLQGTIGEEHERTGEGPAKRSGEVSNADSGRLERSSQKQGRAGNAVGSNREAREREVSNSDIQRLQGSEETGDTQEEGKEPQDQFLTRLSRGETYWETEPNIRRVANGVPSRVDRIKGLGNAIVPQVATVIMQKIKNNM
jgi:DNA-cytosine methyltransferase